ncbi:MAG: hypothetical protein WCV68_04230 [Candidatus Paceibacterota bacterium]|jgi:hypothetical protein
MEGPEIINSKPLAQIIDEIVLSRKFGEGIEVVPVKESATIDDLKASGVFIDMRAKEKEGGGYGSVFDGLAFDPENLRCQSFALYKEIEGKRVAIATMSIIIIPEKLLAYDRFIEKTAEGVFIRDFSDLNKAVGEEPSLPSYVIYPAWTKVADSFRGKFAVPGLKTFKQILEKLEELAPARTFIEVIAQGRLSWEERKEMGKIIDSHEEGDFIPYSKFPFDTSTIGANIEGSNSTVKFACFMGMSEVKNFSDDDTLGPVFIKKV